VALLDAQAGERPCVGTYRTEQGPNGQFFGGTSGKTRQQQWNRADGVNASRFFYVAKASAAERSRGLPAGERNTHPTVKPLALMRWLLTLITPPGGVVLDPFAGSGSTLVAAAELGIEAIGIEQDATYVEIARQRCEVSV
jgi:DNA modification methylase